MASDKVVVEEVSITGTKPSFGARFKSHYKRFWWAHLIALVVSVLVVSLPMVYVGYPRIAQADINDSTLSVSAMFISDPSPESFHLNQTQIIGTDSIFHPKIFSFEAEVGLEGASASFANVTVPQVQAKDGTVVNVAQRVELSDAAAFAAFSSAVMMSEEFGLTVSGRPRLKQGPLPTITVTYDKAVTMKGLNKLKGFTIISMHPVSNRADGNNAVGQVSIPNPSVMTLSMGNLTMDLWSANGTSLGQSFLNDLVLVPGNNTVPMLSNIDMMKVISLLPRNPPYVIPVKVTGNSSTYNGKEIPYFTAALAANKLTVDLNLTEVLGS
ncbi:hypothetical protein P175DRAFT_0475773 [Aspergillus ochraceoroseus IBT 24754]|uniref:Uncharacterized protein n=3 Tax=Aspergillus subgen. Nidulantes TaxID=2720870 RepID=A0A2T5M4H8_9EURO|nr:uncharacterized protein P175DRAFT_0475773 [Aspergillus ochraceoroseus IBT 24754]KKK17823.1 hypothetical protein AOCH_003814 [Aspergillus ochraceoroseus]PTU23441.1 hypothetical protein P175DRAFT_0475773 [Aspergillus ochraceoroseus IBT 24754]